MPATYTHFRFGQDVKQRLPKGLRKIVDLHEDLFDIGLYGPDILFYYHAAVANPVSLTGFRMHKRNAYGFFKRSLLLTREKRAFPILLGFIVILHWTGNAMIILQSMRKSMVYGIWKLKRSWTGV